jgi:ABC-2 type transport system ATP-binding protein
MNPIIQVQNLVKRYGNFTAVDGVSFQVNEGEIFGLLGPNGAGKTTTLEITETLKPVTSGTVIVDGFDIKKNPEAIKSRIGIQLQASGFYPDLNLVELLEMFAVMYQVELPDPMAVLKRFNLEEKATSQYKQLSGGQKQRFSLATTLINNPRIIFLDEPTTGLDPQARINLWDVIRDINKAGTTIVMTTHYMDEAEQLCDRLAIMDHGHVIAEGSPATLIYDLLARGFKRHEEVKPATLEDVFLNLTGRSLRDA